MRFLNRRPDPAPSSFLWSKGYPSLCDVAGPEGYWRARTETCQPASFFREHFSDAHGLVWVRLSTQSRDGKKCDLDHFVEGALPTIRQPFALLTTDGDVLVPSGLATATVDALLASPWLVAWHTQNHDGHADPRFRPLPIGLDFHSGREPPVSPAALASLLGRLRDRRPLLDRQSLRVFTDFNKRRNAPIRREAVAALRGCPHVDFLRSTLSQAAIWGKYARYPFVLSAPGNGLDCHRT
ncbi:MAG: hypothetical protein IT535_08140, partial [Bauldia sp.]|nr:hypothetical protein [Bauldia sp.]